MAHDSRTGCSVGRSAGGGFSGRSASSGRSGLVSGSGRLAFWARLALVVLLGLLAGLGVAWVSARRPEWRPVAVFALVGFGFGVVVVRRWWPRWLRHYAGIAVLGLSELVARRYGGSLGWEVFLASAMLYGLGLGVWDAVRGSAGGASRKCFHAASGCGCVGSVGGHPGSEQVSTSPDNRNASVAELAEAEHRLRVSRRRLELLRPLSEESNRITDEILRLYKLSDEEVLREVGLPRASLATIRELREKLLDLQTEAQLLATANQRVRFWTQKAEAAEAELAKWRSGALRLATWKSHTDDGHRKVDRGTEDGQRQEAGQEGGGSASESEPRAVHIEMPKLDCPDGRQRQLAQRLAECLHSLTAEERRGLWVDLGNLASWPASAAVTQPVGNCWCGAEKRCPTYYDCPASDEPAQPVQNSDENPSELDATAGPNVSGQLDLPFSDAAQQRQQIQAVLRQGDQDIAANRGHDLGEVLADLDGKPSLAQLAPKPAT